MDQIPNELLHFIKGAGPHALSQYIKEYTAQCDSWCPFVSHDIKDAIECYAQHEAILYLLNLLKQYKVRVEYLERDPYHGININDAIESLENPTRNLPIKKFKENIKEVVGIIKDEEKNLYTNLQGFTCLECQRLDEAILCKQNNCCLAATIMAVSATEARLHYLVKKKNKKIYKKYFENATLGELIKLFNKNEYKNPIFSSLKKIIPEKHKPLLDLFNIYRIVSAHPKAASLDYKIADSIINLVFAFLLDPEVKIIDKKLLKHKS